MLLGSIALGTPSSAVTSFKVENNISHIAIVAKGAAVAAPPTSGVEKITAKYISKQGGQEALIVSQEIGRIHAMSAMNDGRGDYNYSGTATGNSTRIEMIKFAEGGGLALDDSSYLKIDITNANSTLSYDVYGIETPFLALNSILYGSQNIDSANSKKLIKCDNYEFIAFAANAAITSITLRFDNGKTATYLLDEIKILNISGDDIQMGVVNLTNSAGTLTTSSFFGDVKNHLFLPLRWGSANCYEMQVQTTGSVEITTMEYIENPTAIAEAVDNPQLINTAE